MDFQTLFLGMLLGALAGVFVTLSLLIQYLPTKKNYMAKVVITIEDNPDGESMKINFDFTPELVKGVKLTEAQNLAGNIQYFLNACGKSSEAEYLTDSNGQEVWLPSLL